MRLSPELKAQFLNDCEKLLKAGGTVKGVTEQLNAGGKYGDIHWAAVQLAKKKLGLTKTNGPKAATSRTLDDAPEAEEVLTQDEPTFANFLAKLKELVKFGEQVQKHQKTKIESIFF